MQENILMLLDLEEIKNITKGLKVALDAINKSEIEDDGNLKENIEEVLVKLLNIEYECYKNIE